MKISEETRSGIRTVYLPPIDVAVPGVDLENISELDQSRYKAWCENEIKNHLRSVGVENAIRRANWPADTDMPEYVQRDMVRTRYPEDDFGSEDVVALENGNVVVLDPGTR